MNEGDRQKELEAGNAFVETYPNPNDAYNDAPHRVFEHGYRRGKNANGREWLPIESAPKDGTMFLCWVRSVLRKESDDGDVVEVDNSSMDFCEWRHFDTGGFFEPLAGPWGDWQEVTHWMPLPPPPSGNEEGKT
jgi:hypothetical protein